MVVYNGEQFLSQAIESLLAQDYDNFELIILDNLSTDSTSEICRSYTKKDARIRYILDCKRRNGHDGGTHIASFARGEYYMLAADDDLWESNYISRLVSALNEDESIGLVYSNAYFIDAKGNPIKEKPCVSGRRLYKSTNSKLFNFCHYQISKHVVPLALGIYRTSVFERALPFATFDATGADGDHLFALKLLTFTRVHSVDEPLFYYRVYPGKERWEDPKYGKYPQGKSPVYMWFYWCRHRLKFNAEIFKVIDASHFSLLSKIYLKLFTTVVSLTRPFGLRTYVHIKNILRKFKKNKRSFV